MDYGMKHANYNLNKKSKSPLLLFRSTPPISAINKFLQVANDKRNTIEEDDIGEFLSSVLTNSNSDSSSNSGGMHGNDDSEIVSYEVIQRNEEINSMACSNNIKKVSSSSKVKKIRVSKDLIKGQWTDDEDRLLKTLVTKYGERKWAMIAGHLEGRAGKQCRERWHNHLRPDIKKDAWDEDEERMLVAAHEQFGNKWAEIARRIPGRSENSIKNHWNATRRRQNSRRKNKTLVDSDGLIQPSILQDYIKFRYPSSKNNTLENTSTTTTSLEAALSPISAPTTTVSWDPHSQPNYLFPESSSDEYDLESTNNFNLVANPCHDELIFMQQFFKNNPNGYISNDDQFDDGVLDSMLMDSLLIDNHGYNDNYEGIMFEDYNYTNNNNITNYPCFNENNGGCGNAITDYQPYDLLDHTADIMEKVDYQGSLPSRKNDMDLFEMIFSQSSSKF